MKYKSQFNYNMKNVLILISALLLCLPMTAQERSKKGEQRPYASNSGFWDNTYIGIGGGINILNGDYDVSHDFDDYLVGKTKNVNTNNITPSIDVFFGKWWTPVVGMRLAYHGYKISGFTMNTDGPFVSQDWDMLCGYVREKMNYNSGRIDVTLNLCNAIQGYRDRFWDVIPYVGFGAANVNGKNVRTNVRTNAWRFMGDAGIMNNLRLCKRLAINIDVRYIMSDSWFDFDTAADNKIDGIFTASAGLTVKMGAVGFRHSEVPDYSAYENQIADYKKQLDDVNAALAARLKQVEDLLNQIAACDKINADLRAKSGVKNSTIILYFALNASELDSKELAILDAFMQGNKNGKVSICATADSVYGSKKYNQKLSEKRASYLAGIMKEKYGVNVTSSEGIGEVDTHSNPVLNRAGIIYVNFE